jgi:hypothetical protein
VDAEIVVSMIDCVKSDETEAQALLKVSTSCNLNELDGFDCMRRGLIHLRFNSFAKAEACFLKGIQKRDPDAHFGLAELYRGGRVRFAWLKAVFSPVLNFTQRMRVLFGITSPRVVMTGALYAKALSLNSNLLRQSGRVSLPMK